LHIVSTTSTTLLETRTSCIWYVALPTVFLDYFRACVMRVLFECTLL
jgi:hypothetical protein